MQNQGVTWAKIERGVYGESLKGDPSTRLYTSFGEENWICRGKGGRGEGGFSMEVG